MAIRRNRIILILCVILLLGSYVVTVEYSRHRRQEIFINEVYFLLKDLHAEITQPETTEIMLSSNLNEILTELDVRCVLHSQEMWSNFSYPRPGVFDLIKSNISKGVYSQKELEELAGDLQVLIGELSDETGKSENGDLSRKEINRILGTFRNNWQ